MTQKQILAIDGGGTSTEIVVQTAAGETLFYDKKSGANYRTVRPPSFKKILQSIIVMLESQLVAPEIEVAVFSFAGIDTKEDWQEAWTILSEVVRNSSLQIKRMMLENDVEAVMHGTLNKKRGVLLLAGTGSIAYGQDADGKKFRVGGWGPIWSDEGSGYWIGREIAKALFQAEDGRISQTSLKKAALELMSFKSVHELVSLQSVSEIARLAQVLEVCCVNEDEVARWIAKRAATELSFLIKTLVEKLDFDQKDSIPIFLGGGVLKHTSCVRRELKNQLTEQYPYSQIELLSKEPIEYIINRGRLALIQ